MHSNDGCSFCAIVRGEAECDLVWSNALAMGWEAASSAYRAVQRALSGITLEPALELRRVQYERLNTLLLVMWPRAQQGDYAAVDRCVTLMDRIDRLFGLSAPERFEVAQQSGVLVIDGSKEDYLKALARARGEQVEIDDPDVVDAELVVDTPDLSPEAPVSP